MAWYDSVRYIQDGISKFHRIFGGNMLFPVRLMEAEQ